MNWLEIVSKIFEVCIIPLLGIISFYVVQYIKIKGSEIIEKVESDTSRKYLTMLQETVCEVVVETNQVYVEALKKEGKFDLEAQKKAFEKTYDKVLEIMNEESVEYLGEMVGDLQSYITTLIEAEVNKNK